MTMSMRTTWKKCGGWTAMIESEDWMYYVSLDGDYAGEYPSLEAAEFARLNERGWIAPEDRKIWRERVQIEDIYPPMSDLDGMV